MKKLSQFLKVHSEMPGEVYLKFGMWNTDSRGHLHSKNFPVSYEQHEVTYARKLHYCSSCQLLTSVVRWLLGPQDTVCLDKLYRHTKFSHTCNVSYLWKCTSISRLALRSLISNDGNSPMRQDTMYSTEREAHWHKEHADWRTHPYLLKPDVWKTKLLCSFKGKVASQFEGSLTISSYSNPCEAAENVPDGCQI